MDEILLIAVLVFAAYLFLSKTFSKSSAAKRQALYSGLAYEPNRLIPEDSVLRRHYITQLRSEIELELCPRPTDFNLQRHYDTLVAEKLECRLAKLAA